MYRDCDVKELCGAINSHCWHSLRVGRNEMCHDVTKSNQLAKLTTYAFHDVEADEIGFLALPFEV